MADSTSCNPPCCGGSGTPGAKVENSNVCIKVGGCTIIGLTEVVDTTDISNPTWTYLNADGEVVAGPLTQSAAVKCPQDVNIASATCPIPIALSSQIDSFIYCNPATATNWRRVVQYSVDPMGMIVETVISDTDLGFPCAESVAPAQLVCLKRIGADDPVFKAWAVGCAPCNADTIKVSLFSFDGQTKLDHSLFQITNCC